MSYNARKRKKNQLDHAYAASQIHIFFYKLLYMFPPQKIPPNKPGNLSSSDVLLIARANLE
jgi:hypothetical protein